jgi:nucleotidyltransferase/DNA polymerase involved in DNA repair
VLHRRPALQRQLAVAAAIQDHRQTLHQALGEPLRALSVIRSYRPSLANPLNNEHFGSYGVRLNGLARGIDESEVIPDCPTKSTSVEDTFERDVPLAETEPMIRCLAAKVWSALHKESRIARTVVLKVKPVSSRFLPAVSHPALHRPPPKN